MTCFPLLTDVIGNPGSAILTLHLASALQNDVKSLYLVAQYDICIMYIWVFPPEIFSPEQCTIKVECNTYGLDFYFNNLDRKKTNFREVKH